MLETIIVTLLPIVVTLMLGFFAGWHHDLNQEQASGILNRMVMLYALPMALFAGIMTTPVMQISSNVPMFIWTAVGMVGGFIVVFSVSRFLLHSTNQLAALRGLAIAGPAMPFVGFPVLGSLFPHSVDIAVATGNLLLNLILLPVAMVFLVNQPVNATASPAAAGADGSNGSTGSTAAASAGARAPSALAIVGSSILKAIRQPVIWAPVLALVLLLCGVDMPEQIKGSFTLLGQATGGVALFSVGAVLFAQKVRISRAVMVNVLSKNILLPLIVFGLMHLVGVPLPSLNLVTIMLAIPTASICVILAVEYRVGEQEMASTLLVSTLASMLTMAGFFWLISL